MSRRVAAEPDHQGPNWPRWFLVVGFVLGTATILATPAFRGPDEFTQTMRIATIDRGYFIPPLQSSNPPGYQVDGCLKSYATLAFNRILVKPPPRWGTQFDTYPCGRPYSPRANGASALANTEVNPPVPYIPALVGLRLGRAVGGATWSYYGARFAQMLAYLLLVWAALRLLPWGRPFLFTVALIPATMQLAGTISADPVTNGLAFVIIAATLRLIDRAHETGEPASWRALGAYGLAIVVFALTKPAALPIAAVAVVLPTAVFGSLRRRILLTASTLLGAAAIAAAWTVGVVSHIRVAILPGADSFAMAKWIRAHPVELAKAVGRAWTDPTELRTIFSELITVVTHNSFVRNPPVWVVVALIAMLVVARLGDPIPGWIQTIRARVTTDRSPAGVVAGADGPVPIDAPVTDQPATTPPEGQETTQPDASDAPTAAPRSRRQRRFEILVAVAICIVGFVVIEYGVALAADPPGARVIIGVQGRYFIPYLPLALLGAAATARSSRRRASPAMVVPLVFLVALNLWWLSVVLRTSYTW